MAQYPLSQKTFEIVDGFSNFAGERTIFIDGDKLTERCREKADALLSLAQAMHEERPSEPVFTHEMLPQKYDGLLVGLDDTHPDCKLTLDVPIEFGSKPEQYRPHWEDVNLSCYRPSAACIGCPLAGILELRPVTIIGNLDESLTS